MSTSSPNVAERPPADEPSGEKSPTEERPSGLRVFASALAAMTTTALLSTLGVAGTIAGAAISSVITVLANFVYSTSLQRTADKVTSVTAAHRARLRQTRTGSHHVDPEARTDQLVDGTAAQDPAEPATIATAEPSDGTTTTQATAVEPGDIDPATAADADGAADTSALSRARAALRSVVDRVGWRKIVAAIAAVFLLILAVVTVVELAAGRTLTDVVRNQEGSGTSVFGGTTDEAPAEDIEPGPGDVPPTDPEPAETPGPAETPEPTQTPDTPSTPGPAEEQPAPPEQGPTAPPVEPPAPEPPAPAPPAPEPPGEGAPDPEAPPAPGAEPPPAPALVPEPTPAA